MSPPLQFETPENVLVQYEVAGLGTRFVAWFVDQILVFALALLMVVAIVAAGLSIDALSDSISDDADDRQLFLYFAGLAVLVWNLGSFVYFAALELLMGGQTFGKRASRIRVVKANGFQLDAPSIVLRNVFRVVDQLPPMWLAPLLSKRSQRPGDLAAGTLVVSDARSELSAVRTALAGRVDEARFRFDRAALKRLDAADYATVERLLDRWAELPPAQQQRLAEVSSSRLAAKLGVEPPAADERLPFLEDLLAAEFRRRDRGLA